MTPDDSTTAREQFFDRLAALSAHEFESFVVDLFSATDLYRNIRREVRFGAVRVDLVADFVGAEHDARMAVVEIKKSALGSADLVKSEVQRRAVIKQQCPKAEYVLVISGRLTSQAKRLADKLNMVVWDPVNLWEMAPPSVLQQLALAKPPAASASSLQKGAQLQQTLLEIQAGEVDAPKYQTWVRDVLEYLFVPPLGPVHYEDSDADRRNRRDVILENWASDPFWALLRTGYHADMVVIDAKNYSDSLKKQPVLDISHYLKRHGCGLFGILVSRKGVGAAGVHAIREQWIASRKLIVCLADSDILQMLDAKDSGARAEPLLQRKIADFRKDL